MATGTTTAILTPTEDQSALVAQQTQARADAHAAGQAIDAFTDQACEHDADQSQPSTALPAVHAGRLQTLVAAPALLTHAANTAHRMRPRRIRRTATPCSPSGHGHPRGFRWGMTRSPSTSRCRSWPTPAPQRVSGR
jgi:hypothetical protein